MANFVSPNQIQIQIGLVLLVWPDTRDDASQPWTVGKYLTVTRVTILNLVLPWISYAWPNQTSSTEVAVEAAVVAGPTDIPVGESSSALAYSPSASWKREGRQIGNCQMECGIAQKGSSKIGCRSDFQMFSTNSETQHLSRASWNFLNIFLGQRRTERRYWKSWGPNILFLPAAKPRRQALSQPSTF